MKSQEKKETIDMIKTKILKRGMPINVRTGGNTEVAEWIGKLLDELLKVDEPIGTIELDKYTACPNCNGAVGISAYYCKKCGSYLKYSAEWG